MKKSQSQFLSNFSFIGSFSYQFDEVGTYYYWSPNVHPSSGYSMRGVIEVLPLESGMGSVEVFWNTFNGIFSRKNWNQYMK